MDFTIRNLPDPVLEDLQRAARLNGRSVEDEASARLARRAVRPSPLEGALPGEANPRTAARVPGGRRPVAEWLAEIEEMQRRNPLPELTPELLDEFKREGRA